MFAGGDDVVTGRPVLLVPARDEIHTRLCHEQVAESCTILLWFPSF